MSSNGQEQREQTILDRLRTYFVRVQARGGKKAKKLPYRMPDDLEVVRQGNFTMVVLRWGDELHLGVSKRSLEDTYSDLTGVMIAARRALRGRPLRTKAAVELPVEEMQLENFGQLDKTSYGFPWQQP